MKTKAKTLVVSMIAYFIFCNSSVIFLNCFFKVRWNILLVIILCVEFLFMEVSCEKFDPVAVTKFCTTPPATDISYTSATVKGKLMDIGEEITSHGHCWSAYINPSVFNSKVEINGAPTKRSEYRSELKGLNPGTKYFVRAYVKTESDVIYGDEIEFTTNTIPPDKLVDIDNNLYETVKIGTQTWMKQNLKVAHFNDGSEIPLVTQNSAWVSITTGGYCWYDNNETANKNTYGALYNWYAVHSGKLCPTGWHEPNDVEWTTLINYLGGLEVAGGKLRETGLVHWNNNNVGATNQSGFTALGAGHRDYDGTFQGNYLLARFWTNTSGGTSTAYLYSLYSTGPQMFRDNFMKFAGYSLRCIKD